MRRILYLAGALWAAPFAALLAAPTASLPYDGLAQGHDVTVPITLQATNNLAGLQADILFNGSRLVCTGAVALVSGPADVVVDGAQIQPGKFRLLAYSPTGTALTNDVVCNVTFSAYPNAANGPAPLGSSTVYFGSDTASTLAGVVNPGLLLVGDAFAFFPGGGRAQFRGTTGSNYVLRASTNLTTWTPILTNPALAGLVWTLDSDALVFPKRFYRISPAQ